MMSELDPRWLRSFHRVAECRSFKAAAEQLEIPTSNLSRYIASLEKHLDTRLIERTTRHMRLTQAGEQLYARTLPLLAALDAALEDVRQETRQISGTLRILLPDSPQFATLLTHFARRHPGLTIHCDTSLSGRDLMQDLVTDGFDLVLTFNRGQLADSGWVARKIAGWPSLVVGSPELIQTYGKPESLQALAKSPCITTLTALNGSPWQFDTGGPTPTVLKVNSRFKVNSGPMAAAAALAGLGFALLPADACQQAIDEGRLIPLVLEAPPVELALYAFYAGRAHLPRKVTLFLDELRAHFPIDNLG
ncbi:LysR family transcriptional regulator [Photobacterium sp. MCCC 1A19761]|uniref:LysR family transcriptional regulator n=1 Tax=Photobacterium sp. MCCC 1A19761 TaxID=3115000 RepID=UPI00307F119C